MFDPQSVDVRANPGGHGRTDRWAETWPAHGLPCASSHSAPTHAAASSELGNNGTGAPVGGGAGSVDLAAPEQFDVELIRGVTRRDRRAFETLYYRHAARLRRYLVRMLRQPEAVEEALNDVMLAIWQSAARFDPSIARPTTWFLAIAHNKALKVLAKRRMSSAEVAYDPPDLDLAATAEGSGPAVDPCDPDTPERTLLGRELGRLLGEALGLLSAEHRTVIELAFGEDRSYPEIASITGVPVNTVKSRMFYARKCLADILRRQGVLDAAGPLGAPT
jgi:RNA polymerase sigma-70 factor (ECF subfamily)